MLQVELTLNHVLDYFSAFHLCTLIRHCGALEDERESELRRIIRTGCLQ
jgi:hypothetical protein